MSNEMITILKGADRVRKRPSVIFGYTGVEGATAAIIDLLKIFVVEANATSGGKLVVSVNSDNSITVLSRDRGILIDETKTDGKPAWHDVFCELYAAPRDIDRSDNVCKENLFGKLSAPYFKYAPDFDDWFVICSAQYVSEFMQVKSVRDGVCKTLEFEKGKSVGDVKTETTDKETGSFIHFKMDREVFGTDEIDIGKIREFLRLSAVVTQDFECELDADGKRETFVYADGPSGYVSEIAKDSAVTPVFTKEIEARGRERYNSREYDASVKVAICFAKNRSLVKCIHNYSVLEEGGTHLDAAMKKIADFVYYAVKSCDIEDISDSLILVIETKCSRYSSNWLNGARKAIKNRMITDMTYDAVGEDFRYFLSKNKNEISKLIK